MAKRFSLIDCGEVQVVRSGYIQPDSLPEIPEVLEVIAKTSCYEQVGISISHMQFLDFINTPVTDATEKEVEVLQENLPEFFDAGVVITEEVIELAVRGLDENTEIVEVGDL